MYEDLGFKKCQVTVLVILLLGFFVGTAIGQTGKIAGRVTDAKTSEPLIGANVVIQGMTMGASTDQDGYFFILNISPGNYSVTTSYIGYQTITQQDVRVNLGKTASLDFALNPTVIQGEAVTIVAERVVIKKDLTASEQMISTEQIDRSWVRSLPEALETQAGMFRGHVRGGSLVETVYIQIIIPGSTPQRLKRSHC